MRCDLLLWLTIFPDINKHFTLALQRLSNCNIDLHRRTRCEYWFYTVLFLYTPIKRTQLLPTLNKHTTTSMLHAFLSSVSLLFGRARSKTTIINLSD